MKEIITKGGHVLFREGIINYIKRKLNITYLDSIMTYTIDYRGKKTKIILNRKFGFVDMMIFKHGIYEKDIIDDIYDELDETKVMLDIGSNIGQHSLLLSSYCKQIYAFEPIPRCMNNLEAVLPKTILKILKHLILESVIEMKQKSLTSSTIMQVQALL